MFQTLCSLALRPESHSDRAHVAQQDADKTYFLEERTKDKDKNPIGFFPHQHDPLAGRGATADGGFIVVNMTESAHEKSQDLIHPQSKDVFKVWRTLAKQIHAALLSVVASLA
jgi:hypothetical protein